MDDQQRVRLDRIIQTARGIHTTLEELAVTQAGKVHFRPSNTGVTMVGLLPEKPQRGHGPYQAEFLRQHFAEQFQKYCVDIVQGRPTPEKRLQSFLIGNAYQHNRTMAALHRADDPTTELIFVTDEIALCQDSRKVVCDLLAFRPTKRDSGVGVPVLIELKSERRLTRLTAQLNDYAAAMKPYVDQFEQLYSALLGQPVRFDQPPEQWLIWPNVNDKVDPREHELLERGIRVVQYKQQDRHYTFQVGRHPGSASSGED